VEIKNGKLKVSSLYVWFDEDFGAAPKSHEHWQHYAAGGLADSLASIAAA